MTDRKPESSLPATADQFRDNTAVIELITAVVKRHGTKFHEIWLTADPKNAELFRLKTCQAYVHFSSNKRSSSDIRVWPPVVESTTARNPQNTLAQMPAEVLYKIATYLDDVGFVCLRNTCARIRGSINIEGAIEFGAFQRYLLRGLLGLNDVMTSAGLFCEACTETSLKSYPDKLPDIRSLKK